MANAGARGAAVTTEPAVVVVAVAQYPIDLLSDEAAWTTKLATWVAEAADAGARLLVFPEYAALELAGTVGPTLVGDLHGQLRATAHRLPTYLATHQSLAEQHRVTIVAGSIPTPVPGGCRNRSYVFGPTGSLGYQDKLALTRWERAVPNFFGGDALALFDLGPARIGVVLCYDIEFPYPARRLVEAGADLLVVPSCTDSAAGYQRVRIGCQARALENQCPVVQAVTVGAAAWSPVLENSCGRAAVYGPPDGALPDTGVLAQGMPDGGRWLIVPIDLQVFQQVRKTGAVANHQDWGSQMATARLPPRIVRLCNRLTTGSR